MARILLIDDDEMVRASVRLTLEHYGHEVVEAHNGRAGLTLLPKTDPDLVITDIVMPDTEGLEVMMELRKHPGLKAIAMSGGGRGAAGDYLGIARRLGAVQVLKKPFTNQILIDAVNAALALETPPQSSAEPR